MSSIKYKVLVTSSEYPEAGMELIRDKYEIVQIKSTGFDDKIKCHSEIQKLISGVHGIVWCTKVPLDKALIEKAGNQLKIVSSMSSGVDHIDQAELKARNILLANTPYVLNDAVADVAILLMLGAIRRLPERLTEIKSGEWENGPERMLGRDVKGSTVGIIGLGGVGETIVERLKGFNIKKIVYCGRSEKPNAQKLGMSYVTFDELLMQSDIVFITCSLNETTKNMMNATAFSKMKNTAVIVNVSRGGVIDQDDLVDALKNKKIYAAGLDVTLPEPLPKDHPLLQLPNCFVIPHIGSATVETRKAMARLSATQLIEGLEKK